MSKALIIIGKLVLALLSVAGMALLILEGWLIWHFEYGIGLPTEAKLTKPIDTAKLGASPQFRRSAMSP